MKYNYFALVSMALLTTVPLFSMQHPSKPRDSKIHIPHALSPFFTLEKGREFENKAVGWIKVPGQGKVWVQLRGKSFYKRGHSPKNYSISYIGHDTNGRIFHLPKGLYFWKDRVRAPGAIMPAAGNKFANQEFDWDSGRNKWHLFSNSRVRWEQSKAEHTHPTREISEILKAL